MSQTMKAAVLMEPREIRFEDRPIPAPGPDDALVRIRSVGVCGSDVHFYREGRIGSFAVTAPLVLGHESSGEVVEVGANARNVKAGDRVAVEPGWPCRKCVYCKRGDYHLCLDVDFLGTPPMDGTFPWQQTIGMEPFLMRMVTEPEFVHRAVEVYVRRCLVYAKAMLDAGCDAIMTTDDYSDNRGPIMGPERYREFIVPGLIRQSEAIHEMGGYFIKHTDGNTWRILDSFVEAKIDGWHGIQPSIGMDLRILKERYGDKLCFFGGVNCETLVAGTADEARAEVRYAIKNAGPGGGLVLTTGNVLQPGTQLANYRAARQETRDSGRYPIAL